MNTERYLFIAVVIIALCAVGYFMLPVYAEYRDAKREQERLEEQLMHVEYEYQQVQEEIHALKSNPRAVERVAREKFGLCRPDEKIYHFDPPTVYLTKDADPQTGGEL